KIFANERQIKELSGAICVDFYLGISHYEVTFVETDNYYDFKTWNELKNTCEQSGYLLVSITTSHENDAIFNFLQDSCTRGDYAIGLSREMGMPRMTKSSWNWESGDTAMEFFWGGRGSEPNVMDSSSAVVYMTTLNNLEPGKWYDIHNSIRIGLSTVSPGYGYICEKSITTTQFSTTAGRTTTQSFTSRILRNSTYRRPTIISTSAINEANERSATTQFSTTAGGTTIQSFTSRILLNSTYWPTITSTTAINEANERSDLMMIVIVSASLVAAVVVLILIYRFHERFCCKSKTKMNPELLMDNIAGDKPCDALSHCIENGCRDVDNEKILKCNTSYKCMPSNRSRNMPGQGKDPGRTNVIQIHIPNSPSDNALEVEKYPLNQSSIAHDRQNPNDYESEENPTYERYNDENSYRIYDGIKSDCEGEVDNPAYDALPFDAKSLYSSPHEMADVAGSVGESKKTVVRAKLVGNHDKVADSSIDALYAKPDMSMKRKYQVDSPSNNNLSSETESNYASQDKTTDVAENANVLKRNVVTAANADDHDLADSKKDALYAKPDLSM
ncbi:uncharacterized protein LOC117108503, partial [Anneissia japonica]|uniref:uncharacterized protein LOC117108503 n=1 Tax=Anneissia japonica TaxID=1529436 RepID=UPI00142570C6